MSARKELPARRRHKQEAEAMFGGPWGRHGRRHRFMERGGLKFALLDLLKDRPRHGYELMRELEERSGGFYSPSPGTVYPTLQMLEDMGYVSSSEDEGRRVYELTREGAQFLEEHSEHAQRHRDRMAAFCGPGGREGMEVMYQMKGLFRDIAEASWRHREDAEKMAAIRDILQRAKGDIDQLSKDGPVQA
jgi:DNA-binding PadR family transcriptional regulator